MPADWTLIFPMITGSTMAIQAATFGAGFFSFVTGLPILFIVWMIMSRGQFDFTSLTNAEWWSYMGGFLGNVYMIMMCFLIPRLGGAIVLGTSVVSQLVTAIILDNFGLLYIPQRPCTPLRGIGISLALLGNVGIMLASLAYERRLVAALPREEEVKIDCSVAEEVVDATNSIRPSSVLETDAEEGDLSIRRQQQSPKHNEANGSATPALTNGSIRNSQASPPSNHVLSIPIALPSVLDWRLVFSVAGGTCLALQAAANGRLGLVTNSRPFAALTSIFLGCFPLCFLYLWDSNMTRTTDFRRIWKNGKWWMFLGGQYGALYMLSTSFLVQRLGTAIMLGVSVTCMLFMATVLDHFGVLNLQRRPATIGRIVGVLMMAVGIILVAIF
ncbi:hypothetical protein SmJEL517_g00266 [Synchytrium microbalum]|uniref:EamA domain-containing protein n=1 Tax=Synchytrium microbalum TaxID=1806994 RepID=A0A507CJW4_9FUNG|nr:uncharacterized protein SmJEL517_g00266 [Synchytrium microbalum]TPX38155.1 hypothetical protein SmJEL517_g00266 [Synchytrium microbalum]